MERLRGQKETSEAKYKLLENMNTSHISFDHLNRVKQYLQEPAAQQTPVLSWGVPEVVSFLSENNIPNVKVFESEMVDGRDLLGFSEQDLMAEPFSLKTFKITRLMDQLRPLR